MHEFDKKISELKIGRYLHQSNSAYAIFDKKKFPIFWNKEAEKLMPNYLLKNSKTGLDEYLKKILSQDEYKRISIFLTNYEKRCSFELEVPNNSSNTNKILKIDIAEQRDGNFFVMLDDITKQKIKEHFLITEKQDAEKAGTLRSLFLANVSHEIRTPIQTILGTIELLSETNLDEEQAEYTRQVSFSADVLLALVNDVLDFSKLESGNMTMENITFNLIDTIEQTIDLISMEAHKKGLEVLIDIDSNLPDFVIGDPNRLRQVLLNFVKNSVKFTEQGSLLISASRTEETITDSDGTKTDKSFIFCEVADTGIGVSQEQKEKIFDTFYQGNAAINRKYGGTGLGLAISKNIVTMMGGQIGLRDNCQNGSVFWFKIPLVTCNKKAPRESILLNKDIRILIVDDNSQTRSAIKRMLCKFKFEDITLVDSGEHAIEIMRTAAQSNKAFDIVFIDMVMPKMDGWRFGAEIHNDQLLKSAKLYLMIPEGILGGDAKMKLLEWFDGYLYKPIKHRYLFKFLNDIYRESQDGKNIDEIQELEPIENISLNDTNDNSQSNMNKKNIENDADFSDMKILAVDDHPVNLKLLKIMLEKNGMTVSTAEDGQQAIDAILQNNFDIVFMDIQMPVLNGYEAAQILRQRGYENPIIACTAGSQEDERTLCLSMGINDIITKPFNRTQLLAVVKKYRKK